MPTSIHGKASILAIGTELTTGQITNRNAAWLSEQLVSLGAEVVLHETVADDDGMIRSALDRCNAVSSLIFVTGGLGPTTDDFTRDSVSRWLGKPLAYHEPSWNRIHERLTRLGIPVAESNRQQCYFPEGAEIIANRQGTADAFAASRDGETHLWVLPGPPREVEAVWKDGIEAKARQLLPPLKPLSLLTWQCLGKSEAELGEITERTLAGSGLSIGYRAHRPFVEIKVWVHDEDMRNKEPWLKALDLAIAPWVATRQGEDLGVRLLKLLQHADEVDVYDAATGGVLTERLGTLLREPPHSAQSSAITLTTDWNSPASPLEWVEQILSEAQPETLTLAIAGFTQDGEWALGFREGTHSHAELLKSPYHRPELMDRARRHVTEVALKRWSEWLHESMQ
jgi:nicotinamide-nucleotide amidase